MDISPGQDIELKIHNRKARQPRVQAALQAYFVRRTQ
jgi:hypothetical protein